MRASLEGRTSVLKPRPRRARRREQQRRFGTGDGWNEPYLAQHGIELRQRFRVQFDDKIPAAIGGVNGRDFGEAAQRSHHTVGSMAFDFDHHDAAHALFERVRPQDHGIAEDLTLPLQPFDAGAHRRTRHTEIDGEIGDGAAAVMPQQGHQFLVE